MAAGSVSGARWLLGVTASVVLAFVVATFISQSMESKIAERAHLIISNAMPSIQMLSTARGQLHRLTEEVDRYAMASAVERPKLAEKIAARRDSIDFSLSDYSGLPLFPEEDRLYERARSDFQALQAELAEYMTNVDQKELASVHRLVDELDESLERINTFDATQGQRLGYEIEHIRGQTRATTVLLDAVSVVLAVSAAVLAVRQLRRAARAREEERQLRDRREAELTSQNEALGEFAGRIAHDILSPLSAASLSLDVVRELSPNPLGVRALDAGSAAIRRVHTLVDGLLAFSRAGGQPEPGVSAELAPVLEGLLSELADDAHQHGIALGIGLIPDGYVACSAGVLSSIVGNLVSNAIKYMGNAPEKQVSVAVRDAGARWRVEVEDTGPGIPPAQQQRIFEPYTQLAHGSAGIGLGLATVDRLVRAHGGSIGVISPARSGGGSLFWFELPKRQPAPSPEQVAALAVAGEPV